MEGHLTVEFLERNVSGALPCPAGCRAACWLPVTLAGAPAGAMSVHCPAAVPQLFAHSPKLNGRAHTKASLLPCLALQGYFDMTLQEAASRLGVGVTKLKMVGTLQGSC